MAKDYSAGEPAENFYKYIVSKADFPGEQIIDLRGNHTEGDFSVDVNTPYIIEVKGDYISFNSGKPSGRLPIEIKNADNRDGEGWFTHCRLGNVEELNFVCYDGENKVDPVCSIRVPFGLLEAYVTEKLNDASYRRSHYFSTKAEKPAQNLCIPLRELYEHCGATLSTARTKNPELQKLAQAALDKMGIAGTVGEYAHVSFSEADRIGGLPKQNERKEAGK